MVQKATMLVYLSDEMIVDARVGSLEEQKAAAERILARAEEIARWYNLLPWHRRARIQARALVRRALGVLSRG